MHLIIIFKLSEPATLQFEKPVDTSIFKDYLQYVETPMDLSSIDRKIDADAYKTPEDFEYDVNLVFKNCEAYNVPKKNSHIVALARHCIKTFRKLFHTNINSWEASTIKKIVNTESSESLSRSMDLGSGTEPLSKKMKLERGKSINGPRKSLPTMHLTSVSSTVATTLSRQTSNLKTSNQILAARENAPRIKIKMEGPIPLHVAIAQIKDSFPSRRLHKDLETWEGSCSRFYRELIRHPWLSATRPKFIFSCPVPILFPELKEAYSAKVARPIDLTTIECKLLQGLYKSPQDMTDDVALVFSNAVTFNKAGYEVGEPLSCAYYDASRHLLRYSRWLSLECFDQYLIEDVHDDGAKQVGPIPSWKLRRSYWIDAKEEMEDIVFNQVIDLNHDGRYTWMETECEKLLKCLRHQSDYKKMDIFLDFSTYPVDYSAFISKPMDWKSCERALQQQKYRTFGEIVSDLRLIFSNALTYNGPAKGTDSVSGRAYDAALFMSSKLEVHINKMLITVSDRLLRERIDDTILGREQIAAEKAEETRLRNEWQQRRERLRSEDPERRISDSVNDRNEISKRHFEFSRKSSDATFNYDKTDINRTFPPLSSVIELATQEFLVSCGLYRMRANIPLLNIENWNHFIAEFKLDLSLVRYHLHFTRYYFLRVGGGEQSVSVYWDETFYKKRRNPSRGLNKRYVDDLGQCYSLMAMQQECPRSCVAGSSCVNRRIARKMGKNVEKFKTKNKGNGLRAKETVMEMEFIIEYCGAVVNAHDLSQMVDRSYLMSLNNGMFIDGYKSKCKAKYLNHSCDPNCCLQVWDVCDTPRVGVFALRDIKAKEELTIDYRWSAAGDSKTRCFCGSVIELWNCGVW